MEQLNETQLLAAAKCMEAEGGGFAGHIARAFYAADSSNRARLLDAFEHLFEKFHREHLRNQNM